MSKAEYSPGLEGVIAGLSQIADVDPSVDTLIYRGYDVRDLAAKSTFEEVAYLLIKGALPNKTQLEEFNRYLIEHRALPKAVMETLRLMPTTGVHPMDTLKAGVATLQLHDPIVDDNSHEGNVRKAMRMTAAIPTIITACHRLSQGLEPVAPNPTLGNAANFLYMLHGSEADAVSVRVFDASLILYAEHGYNASTFAARVTASTLSDIHSAIVSGIGTLKGPLHGGANEEVMHMLLEVGTVENAEPWIRHALANKKKVMGFGHRVYKNGDSRAPLMKQLGLSLADQLNNHKWHELADVIEQVMIQEKNIHPNVDYPSAIVYYLMGIPIPLYTPIFALARVAGWSAHVIEQLDNNRLIRPLSIYEGPRGLTFIPLEERSSVAAH